MFNGFRNQIRCATNSHEVGCFVFFDCFNATWAAFRFTNHDGQARLCEHHFCEFIHARGGGWTCRANDFITDRIDRADVVNGTVCEIDRQWFAFGEHVGDALVCGVTTREHFTVEEQCLTWCPAFNFSTGEGVQVDTLAFFVIRCPVHIRPCVE